MDYWHRIYGWHGHGYTEYDDRRFHTDDLFSYFTSGCARHHLRGNHHAAGALCWQKIMTA